MIGKALYNHLIDVYDKTFNGIHNKVNCLSDSYPFRGVNVKYYFDFYDKHCPSLSIVLSLGKRLYLSPLDIRRVVVRRQYLYNIDYSILISITNDFNKEELGPFFDKLRKELSKCSINDSGSYDKKFHSAWSQTKRYSKNKTHNNQHKVNKNKPFLKTIEHRRMADTTKRDIAEKSNLNISYDTLDELQKHNLTLVRTSDPKERKDMTLLFKEKSILKKYNISLN